jgi:ammonium transporter, Amt family
VGVAVAWLVALLGSLVILKVVDLAVCLRVSDDQEIQGRDLA